MNCLSRNQWICMVCFRDDLNVVFNVVFVIFLPLCVLSSCTLFLSCFFLSSFPFASVICFEAHYIQGWNDSFLFRFLCVGDEKRKWRGNGPCFFSCFFFCMIIGDFRLSILSSVLRVNSSVTSLNLSGLLLFISGFGFSSPFSMFKNQ